MTDTLITAVIAALSAVFGAGIAAYFGNRAQAENNRTLIAIEEMKLHHQNLANIRSEKINSLKIIFKALNHTPREFSTSKVVSTLDSKIGLKEYDAQYFSEAEKLDEARFLAQIYAPQIVSDLEKIYSAMNIYWGNVRGAIINQQENIPESANPTLIQNAINSSKDIDSLARGAKNVITVD